MSEDTGRRGDLKIKIEQTTGGWWKWEVTEWNQSRNQWNRQRWILVRSSVTLTEWGARREARGAVEKIRFLETRKSVVYYDPPRQANDPESD